MQGDTILLFVVIVNLCVVDAGLIKYEFAFYQISDAKKPAQGRLFNVASPRGFEPLLPP